MKAEPFSSALRRSLKRPICPPLLGSHIRPPARRLRIRTSRIRGVEARNREGNETRYSKVERVDNAHGRSKYSRSNQIVLQKKEQSMTASMPSNITVREELYINGEWVKPTGTGMLDVINSTTEEVMGRIPEGTPDDVNRAVAAARAAFESWSATSVEQRAAMLGKIASGLSARQTEIATVIANEVGMPLPLATMVQAGMPAMVMGAYAKMIGEYSFDEQIGNSVVVREPVGVVGCITPWNFPLHQVVAKIAPALAAGCTVVLKPSEVAPLTAFILAEICEEAGLPAGAFNLVTGLGPVGGEALAAHPEVDMISFTGSTRAGNRVSELAAQTIKRVALELGGKSASVILDDADLEKAV